MLFFKFPKLIGWHEEDNRFLLSGIQKSEWSSNEVFNEMRFYKYLPGRIIFLLGTSSAGKSSIVGYIKENSIKDPNLLKFTGTDAIFHELFVDCFYKNLPKETMFLFNQIHDVSKIVEYINEPEKFILDNLVRLNLKSKNSLRIKTILKKFHNMRDKLVYRAVIQYQYYCAKAIITSLLQGNTIIVDTVELKNYFQALEHYLIQCKKDIIVVYCSPQRLEEHIIQRNKTGIKYTFNGLRFFFPFKQYDDIYTPTKDSLESIDQIILFNIKAIDSDAQVACLKSYILALQAQDQYCSSKNKIWQNLLSKVESIISESNTIKNTCKKQLLIDRWFPTKMNAIYIKPRIMYQMFLNSGTLSIVECGKKALKVIDEPNDEFKTKNSNVRKRLSF